MKKKRNLLLIALLLVLALTLTACGAENSGAEQPAVEDGLTPVTLVLDWTPNLNHLGAYVAAAQGWFAEEGLDVSIVQPGDNLALQLVASGQAEFGFSYQEELTYARAAGIDAVSVAAVIRHNTSCFAAPVQNGVREVADFQGRTYGGWGGQIESALLDYLLEQQGLTPDVTVVDLGSSDFFAATESGRVDFSWIFYGVTGVEAERRGADLDLIWLRDLAPELDYYTPVIAADAAWLAENEDVARRFLRALGRGYTFAAENPQEAAALMCENEAGLDAELVSAGAEFLADQWQADGPYWGQQELAVWSGFSQWLTDQGLLEAGFVPEDAFTNDYLPEQADGQ